MKKTVIIICAALVICAALCITAVHFTGKNDVSETSETDGITTEAADTEEEEIVFEDLSAERGYGLSLVQIDKESPRYDEPYYVREDAEPTRTVTLVGKTVTVKYVESCEWLGRDLKDEYEDEDGNEYFFAEDGTFLSYIGGSELSSFSSALYIDKGVAADITEDEAIVIAEKIGKEVFGEAFDKVKLERVKYEDGIYRVYYEQRLGADGSLLGLSYHASILADGRIFGFSMSGVVALRDLDESKYELVKKEHVEREIAVNA